MDNTNPHPETSGTEQEQSRSFIRHFQRRTSKETLSALYDDEKPPQTSPRPEPERSYPSPQKKHDERSVNILTAGLVIEGNVTSQTDMVIHGTIHGNITCHSNVELSGEVTGNIQAKNIRVNGGSVKGDIGCTESLTIEKSRIEGNLSAAQVQINNRIEGDITVQGTLALQREANIQGNITAAGLSVEEGAMMNGRITITREGRESASGFEAKGYAPKPTPVTIPEPAAGKTSPVSEGLLPQQQKPEPAGDKK